MACLKEAPSFRIASAALVKVRPMVYLWNCSPTISRARASDSPTRMTIAIERIALATVSGFDFFPAPQTNVGPFLMGTPFGSTSCSFLLFLGSLGGFGALGAFVFVISAIFVLPWRVLLS